MHFGGRGDSRIRQVSTLGNSIQAYSCAVGLAGNTLLVAGAAAVAIIAAAALSSNGSTSVEAPATSTPTSAVIAAPAAAPAVEEKPSTEGKSSA